MGKGTGSKPVFITWDLIMHGMRREIFSSQEAFDSYLHNRQLQALMPWPHRPAVPVTQLSELESEGLYYELPHNAAPGSPGVKDLGRAPQGLQGQSLRSPWIMAPDNHIYTVSISLTDTEPALHPQGRQQQLADTSEPLAKSVNDMDLAGPEAALPTLQRGSSSSGGTIEHEGRLPLASADRHPGTASRNAKSHCKDASSPSISNQVVAPQTPSVAGRDQELDKNAAEQQSENTSAAVPGGDASSRQPLEDQQQTQQQSFNSPTLSTELRTTDMKLAAPRTALVEQATATAELPLQAAGSSSPHPEMASATSAGAASATSAEAAPSSAASGSQPAGSASATSASSAPASASGLAPVSSATGRLVFKYGTEMNYTAVEAACRAAVRTQQQCLSSSQEYLTPMAHSWVTKFQQLMLSQGLADSLTVLPGLTWFPGSKPGPLTEHVDYVFYDGAQTIFICCLLFHSRFHWLQPNLRTHEKVVQLADGIDLAIAAADVRPTFVPPGPEEVLHGMRVGAVAMMPALQGNTQTDYVKGVVQACKAEGVSLFSADSEVLHVAESRPLPWRRSSTVAASARSRCGGQDKPGRFKAVGRPQLVKRSGFSRWLGGGIRCRLPRAPTATAARPLRCGC